jgi:hypothetical protein
MPFKKLQKFSKAGLGEQQHEKNIVLEKTNPRMRALKRVSE